MRIRIVKTGSGKYALQVVSKRGGVLTVHKHIGTFGNETEKALLIQKAHLFIQSKSHQISFKDYLTNVSLEYVSVTQSRPLFTFELLSRCYDKLGFANYPDSLIKDLVIARIYRPASKQGLQENIYEALGRSYSLKTIYRHIQQSLQNGIKERYQEALVNFARQDLGDSLQLVFYDVTTLFFDSQTQTTLKNFGFSKDHRSTDTQIVIGLVVNRNGFPLYFDVFAGSTFEGHTFIQVIQNIRSLLKVPELVVVADAAMLSQENIDQLVNQDVSFIVGARLGNLSPKLIDQIHTQLNQQDNQTAVFTYLNQRLICQYSAKRAAKDRSDRKKQIEKAQHFVADSAGISRRYRFVKKSQDAKYLINNELITKAEKLEGIKGYITNTTLETQVIIDRYHDLWHIENSFRITKSDLEARPIFHRLDDTIKAHMVMVFAGLAISKYIEQSTGLSIKKALHYSGRVLTHTLINTRTGEKVEKETMIEDPNLKRWIDLLRTLGH
jgi:transposase